MPISDKSLEVMTPKYDAVVSNIKRKYMGVVFKCYQKQTKH